VNKNSKNHLAISDERTGEINSDLLYVLGDKNDRQTDMMQIHRAAIG
jgi:hypothetical protein